MRMQRGMAPYSQSNYISGGVEPGAMGIIENVERAHRIESAKVGKENRQKVTEQGELVSRV